jgi:hypothetical protein
MPIDLDADPGRKEVFAHFGFAVGKAQVVERLLGALVVYPDLVRLQTQGQRNKAIRRTHNATLGPLLTRLRENGQPGLANHLRDEIREVRDMTVHRFYWENGRDAKLNTAEGQRELIAELDAIAARCDAAETHLRKAISVLQFNLAQADNPVIQRIRTSQRGGT